MKISCICHRNRYILILLNFNYTLKYLYRLHQVFGCNFSRGI